MQLGSLGKANLKAEKSLTLGSNFSKQMGLLKTHQEMFVAFLGNTLEENKGFIPPELVQPVWQGCPSVLGKYTFKMGAY